MTTFSKFLIGVSGFGVAVGGGVLAANLLSKPEVKTIKDKLISEGFITDIGDQWQTILTAYNNVTDGKKIFDASKLKKEELKDLQKHCEDSLNKENISDENYKKVKQWCVKPETIEIILKRNKYELLDATADKKDKDSKWEQITLRLKENKQSFPNIGEKMKGTKDEDVKALKEGCLALKANSLKTIEDGFNEKFEQARSWCSIKKE